MHVRLPWLARCLAIAIGLMLRASTAHAQPPLTFPGGYTPNSPATPSRSGTPFPVDRPDFSEATPPAAQSLPFAPNTPALTPPTAESIPEFDDEYVVDTAGQPLMWRLLPTSIVPLIGPRTDEQGRYRGLGEQLTSTSWLARPVSLGGFGGGMFGNQLIHGRLSQHPTFFGGIHYGWDYDHRWGIDRNVGFVPLRTSIANSGVQNNGRAAFAQVRLLHYPWGDMRWRPYVATGLGVAEYRFNDDIGSHFQRALLMVSFSAGIKYLLAERLAFYAEASDIVVPGTGELSTTNNLTVVGSFEYRFKLPKRLQHRL